jgi:hypothetical protein
VTKSAFGCSPISIGNDGQSVSIGDELKATASDCLKKSASLFGVGCLPNAQLLLILRMLAISNVCHESLSETRSSHECRAAWDAYEQAVQSWGLHHWGSQRLPAGATGRRAIVPGAQSRGLGIAKPIVLSTHATDTHVR